MSIFWEKLFRLQLHVDLLEPVGRIGSFGRLQRHFVSRRTVNVNRTINILDAYTGG